MSPALEGASSISQGCRKPGAGCGGRKEDPGHLAAAGSTGPAFLNAPSFLPPSCPIMSHRCCLGGHGRKSRSSASTVRPMPPFSGQTQVSFVARTPLFLRVKGQVALSLPVVLARALWVPMAGSWPARGSCFHPGGPWRPDPQTSLKSGSRALGPLPGSPPRVSAASCTYHVWCPLEPTPALNPACRGPCVAPLPSGLSPLSEPVCTRAVRGRRGREAGPGAPRGVRAVRGWDGCLQAPAGCHQSEP